MRITGKEMTARVERACRTYTKEDFENPPEWEVGDFIISGWRMLGWKRFTAKRIVETGDVWRVVSLRPIEFGKRISHWKVELQRFTKNGLEKNVHSNMPSEKYVKVTEIVSSRYRGAIAASKFHL